MFAVPSKGAAGVRQQLATDRSVVLVSLHGEPSSGQQSVPTAPDEQLSAGMANAKPNPTSRSAVNRCNTNRKLRSDQDMPAVRMLSRAPPTSQQHLFAGQA